MLLYLISVALYKENLLIQANLSLETIDSACERVTPHAIYEYIHR